jgi:DNA-binding NarL/FixJ family response regulator
MNREPIRVLIADDDADFRQGLQALLRTVEQVSVIGAAASGAEAIQRVADTQPDLVLMDLSMPGINGIEATRTITNSSPHVAVLMLTMFEDDESVLAAMRAGARGYILKGAARAEIVRTIEAAIEGGIIFGPGVARRVLNRFALPPAQTQAPFPQLTTRERDILTRVARGLNNEAIARELTVSPKTVRNHVHSIYSKLQIQSRAEAITQARDAGLGQREPDERPRGGG